MKIGTNPDEGRCLPKPIKGSRLAAQATEARRGCSLSNEIAGGAGIYFFSFSFYFDGRYRVKSPKRVDWILILEPFL